MSDVLLLSQPDDSALYSVWLESGLPITREAIPAWWIQVKFMIWCYVMRCDVMLCAVMLCDVMLCDVMWCDVMWYDVMWCDVMWCYVMWCYVMWCDSMWYVVIMLHLMILTSSFSHQVLFTGANSLEQIQTDRLWLSRDNIKHNRQGSDKSVGAWWIICLLFSNSGLISIIIIFNFFIV